MTKPKAQKRQEAAAAVMVLPSPKPESSQMGDLLREKDPSGQACRADLGRLFPTCAHSCDVQGTPGPACSVAHEHTRQGGHSVLAAMKPCDSQATSHGRRLNKYLGTTEDYGLNNLWGNISTELFCRVKLHRKG